MKHDPKQVKQKADYGLVSPNHPVDIFEKSCTVDHMFAKDIWERREEEIRECAKKAQFYLFMTLPGGAILFRHKKSNNGSN